jgi:hypothetical protein
LVGVAVNVTGVPVHTGLTEARIDTLTGRPGVTVIVIVFDVAGLTEGQSAKVVITTYTWSLLTGV